jgi:hypothetical protein
MWEFAFHTETQNAPLVLSGLSIISKVLDNGRNTFRSDVILQAVQFQ